MVSLPQMFHTISADDTYLASTSTLSECITNMDRTAITPTPGLAVPGSLKAVFNSTATNNSTILHEYVDEIVPGIAQCSNMGSNASIARRSRMDDSAGEGLRRNVLVRNAMLSSLERERRQMEEEAAMYSPTVSHSAPDLCVVSAEPDEETQFFEDLLSELSGSERSIPDVAVPESTAQIDVCLPEADLHQVDVNDEEVFVELDASLTAVDVAKEQDLPTVPIQTEMVASGHVPLSSLPLSLANSSVSAVSADAECVDSGFAEETSRSPSTISCYTSGYPHVCPYPAVSSYVGGSSEELPALVDDDSDLDDDDERAEVFNADENDDHHGYEAVGSDLFSTDGDATISRPLSPVTSPIHSICIENISFRHPLSPEHSRPTSPISSASSKGDGEGTSPLLLAADLGPLPSFGELSLQMPAATGADLLPRPSRALAGACFGHNTSCSSTDRMRWTTSPATHLRPTPSTPTLSDFHLHRPSYESYRSNFQAVAANDQTHHGIVLHWSR